MNAEEDDGYFYKDSCSRLVRAGGLARMSPDAGFIYQAIFSHAFAENGRLLWRADDASVGRVVRCVPAVFPGALPELVAAGWLRQEGDVYVVSEGDAFAVSLAEVAHQKVASIAGVRKKKSSRA